MVPNDAEAPSLGVGSRLRVARRACGISTRAAAEILTKKGYPLTHATIANYEKGATRPSLALLAALATLYERPINWFLTSGPLLSDVRYRCLKSVGVSHKLRFEGEGHRWLQSYLSIERVTCVSLVNQFPDFAPEPDESGASLALRLRSYLRLGDAPLPSVIQTLEGFGVYVIEIQSKAKIDAIAGHLEKTRVVVLNCALSNDRVRLTAAHELGHHLYEDCTASPRPDSGETERRGFEFASHLLMPDTQLEAAFKGYSMIRLVQYKQRFGVSLAAMIYRAKQKGLIRDDVYQRLWIEFSKRGWRKNEPGTVLPDRPRRFEEMLETAVTAGHLSWQDAAKRTGLREDELRARVLSATRAKGIGKEEQAGTDAG